MRSGVTDIFRCPAVEPSLTELSCCERAERRTHGVLLCTDYYSVRSAPDQRTACVRSMSKHMAAAPAPTRASPPETTEAGVSANYGEHLRSSQAGQSPRPSPGEAEFHGEQLLALASWADGWLASWLASYLSSLAASCSVLSVTRPSWAPLRRG